MKSKSHFSLSILTAILMGFLWCSFVFGAEFSIAPIPQQSGTKVTLLDTFFLDTDNGWAVGAGGTMLRTDDGGAQWKSIPRRTAALLMSIYFSGNQYGWVVGQHGTILHTQNGGNKWLPQFSGTTSPLYGICLLYTSDAADE